MTARAVPGRDHNLQTVRREHYPDGTEAADYDFMYGEKELVL